MSYLPKVPGSAVDAVCRANVDDACIIEHILLPLPFILQEDNITCSKNLLRFAQAGGESYRSLGKLTWATGSQQHPHQILSTEHSGLSSLLWQHCL